MNWQTLGFEKIKVFFETAIMNNSLAHAYIFSGQEMIGKKTFALELAALLGLKNHDGMPSPNLLVIDPSDSESGQSIAIDEIRKIKNFVSLSPYSGSRQLVIINDAHAMTVEAQNALLKILEEPNPASSFILVTSSPNLLLPTIGSRCQGIRFPSHPRNIIDGIIKSSGLPKPKAEFLAQFSNGRVGLLKKILDNDQYEEVKKSVEDFILLAKADINDRFLTAQKMAEEDKDELRKNVLYWILYLRIRLDEPRVPRMLRGLLRLYEILSQPQYNQRLALENFLAHL